MKLYEDDYWIIVLAPMEEYLLGSTCIINKRGVKSNSELSEEEILDLFKLEKELERILKKIFNANDFEFANLCIGNVLNYVLVPRYYHDVALFTTRYKDKNYGKSYLFNRRGNNKNPFDEDQTKIIANMISKEIEL